MDLVKADREHGDNYEVERIPQTPAGGFERDRRQGYDDIDIDDREDEMPNR